MASTSFSDRTQLPPFKERFLSIILGISGALGYILSTDLNSHSPIGLFLRDAPLYFSALILSPASFALALLLSFLPIYILSQLPLLILMPSILAITSVFLSHHYYKKIPVHLPPSAILLMFLPWTELHLTLGQPISGSLSFLTIITACLCGVLIRYQVKVQEFLGIMEPKGWLTYFIPFYSALLIFPFALSSSEENDFFVYVASIILCLTAILFASSHGDPHIDEMAHGIGFKPKGFSGANKEYFQRKNSEFESAIALTAKLSSFQDTQSGKNLTSARRDGIMVIHQNGEVTFLNRKLREFFSLTSPHVIGRNFQELPLPEEIKERVRILIPSALQHGSRVTEVRLNATDSVQFLELKADKADSIEDSTLGGDPHLVIFRVKDITEKRNLEEHLAKTHLLETLGTLVKKSLPPLKDLVALSLKESSVPQVREISHYINKISDFAEENADPIILDAFQSISHNLEELQRASSAEITLDGATNGDFKIKISPHAFLHILTSILSNAAESYPQEISKAVTVHVACETLDNEVIGLNPSAHPGNFVRIKVIDHGEGMTPDVLSKAFEPLFTTKKNKGHHGLGLSVSFSLLRTVDGFLTIESSSGRGTTVTIYLPKIDS